jgi:hypothetical protein
MYAISTMVIISIVEVPTTSILKDVFSSSGIDHTFAISLGESFFVSRAIKICLVVLLLLDPSPT